MTVRTGSLGDRQWSWVAVLVLALSAVRLATNLHGALQIDEVFYARTGWGLFHGNPYQNPTHSIAPTAKYFIGLGQLVFGRTSLGVRLPVALFGLATMFLSYRLGTALSGSRTGALAAILVASNYFFVSQSVVGLLDVPLAFFFLASVWLAVRAVDGSGGGRWTGLALGVAVVGALTTKVYGFVYVFPVVAAVAAITYVRRGRREAVETLRPGVASGFATLLLLYLPFAFFPHPPVLESYGPPSLSRVAQALLAVPVLGNFTYVVGASVVQNVIHVGNGHAVTVGEAVYQYPPVWSYLYWLFEKAGAVFLLSVVVTAFGTVYESVRRRHAEATVLAVSTLVPLLALSLLTVKMPRYVLPLVPVLAVTGVHYFTRVAAVAVERFSPSLSATPSRSTAVTAVLCVLLLGALVAPPSPLLRSLTEPVNTDSGYDDVTAYIEQHAENHPDEELLVLTYHNVTFDYYFDESDHDRHVGLKASQVRQDDQYRAYLESTLESADVDFVVDLRENDRLDDLAFSRYFREHSRPVLVVDRSPSDVDLVVYEMNSTT
jgi:4-amino-4-deoxy-L-arabinose transferase-like glycosyltransferase